MLTRTQVINAVVDDWCSMVGYMNERPHDFTTLDARLRKGDPLAQAVVACDFPSLDAIRRNAQWVIHVLHEYRDLRRRHGWTLSEKQRAVLAAATRLLKAAEAARAEQKRGGRHVN